MGILKNDAMNHGLLQPEPQEREDTCENCGEAEWQGGLCYDCAIAFEKDWQLEQQIRELRGES